MKQLAIVLSLLTLELTQALPCRADDEFGGKPRKVQKSDAEWAKLLSRPQFMVTRKKATEPAFSGKYVHNKLKGVYFCVCCDTELFSSRTKFESGTGWPSFWQPINPRNIDNEADYSTNEERVEVLCNTCGAHLGHVFTDGPPPTGLRYCMNSLSLKFVKDGAAKKDSTSKEGAPAQQPKDDSSSKESEKR